MPACRAHHYCHAHTKLVMKPYRDKRYNKVLISWIKDHPFISISIFIHLIVVYAIYTYGSYQLRQGQISSAQKNALVATEKLRQYQQKNMQRRVDNLEKIKKLMHESADPKYIDHENRRDVSDEGNVNDPSMAGSPKALLNKAMELSTSIRNLEINIKADDLVRVLNISKSDALKEAEKTINSLHDSSTKKISENDLDKINTEIKRLEADARQFLEKRAQQLYTKASGVHVISADSKAVIPRPPKDADASQVSMKHGHHSGAGLIDGAQVAMAKVKEMTAFLSAPDYAGGYFLAGGGGHIPVASGAEKKAKGMIFGEGGTYAKRVYLNSWYVIGPFSGHHGEALFNNPSYPPEDIIDLDATYMGKDDKILTWNYVTSNSYPFIPPDQTIDSVYYGYGEISFNQESDVWLWFGADDDLRVWVNDQLVWNGGNTGKRSFLDNIYRSYDRDSYWKNWNLSEGKKIIHFQKGRNTILFKLSNGPNPNGVFASLIITPQ